MTALQRQDQAGPMAISAADRVAGDAVRSAQAVLADRPGWQYLPAGEPRVSPLIILALVVVACGGVAA